MLYVNCLVRIMSNRSKLIAVVGPTASGKTSLSVDLALKLNGEIISADSMQIYKGMDIATAKPSKEEKKGIPHHLMDFLDPTENFSVSHFVTMAHSVADDIISRGKLPILCGGTGLYVRSFIENIRFSDEKSDPELREELLSRYKNEGGEILIRELSVFDPQTASQLIPSAYKRIIRAIEIYRITGIPMSEWVKKSKEVPSPYDSLVIGITFSDRQKLYERINKRVDIMLEEGLVEEAKKFYSSDVSQTAAAAIGYKELRPYLEGEKSLEEAVEDLKKETRHYAKRQLTWFRRDEYIKWIESDKCVNVLDEALRIIRQENFN